MKTMYLLPHATKKWGWILLIPGMILGIAYLTDAAWLPEWKVFVPRLFGDHFPDGLFTGDQKNNIVDELLYLFLMASTLMIAFSRCREEDEYIRHLRMESLLWAVWVNTLLLTVCTLFVFDMAYFHVMVVNLFSTMWLFVARFHWKYARLNHAL